MAESDALLLIEVPEKDKLVKGADYLCNLFTKDHLLRLARPIGELIQHNRIHWVDSKGNPTSTPIFLLKNGTIRTLGSMSKDDLAKLTTLFSINLNNSQIYIDHLNREVIDIFEIMARQGFMGSRQLCELTGNENTVKKEYSWSSSFHIQPPFDQCQVFYDPKGYRYQDKQNLLYLKVPYIWTNAFISRVYPLANKSVIQLDTIPKEEDLTTYTAESTLIPTVEILSALHKTGQLEAGKSKLLTQSMLKLADKSIAMPEPTAWENIAELQNWCHHVIEVAFMIWAETSSRKSIKTTAAKIKDFWDRFKLQVFKHTQMVSLLLPHITGITSSIISNSRGLLVIESVNALLKVFSSSKKSWLDVEQIKQYIYLENMENALVLPCFSPYYSSNVTIPYDIITRENVKPDTVYHLCGRPFIDGYLMALAALGCVEVAMEKPSDKETYISGVKYVRLTDAGLFMLGIKNDLEIKAEPQLLQQFEIDPERLIIRILSGPPIYNNWIESISRSIGSNRYLVTEKKVLDRCTGIKDIDALEHFFHSNICANPGPAWEKFFNGLKRKASAVVQSTGQYLLFEVAKDDPELHKLITTDPRLRGKVLRAEGYMVLVERTLMPLFKMVLKEHGYFI